MELVTVAPSRQLESAAAASYERMRRAGMPGGITSAYRTPQEQQELRNLWLANPARYPFAQPPERSRHVAGVALDIPPTPEAWLRAHPEHGWRFIDPKERWHAEHFPHLDQHRSETPPGDTTPADEGDDHMLLLARLQDDPRVFVGDGITRRHVQSEEELSDLIYKIQTGALKGDPQVQVVGRIDWLGTEIL